MTDAGHHYVFAYEHGPDGLQPGLTYYPKSKEAAVKLAEALLLDHAGAVAMHYQNGLTGVRGRERVLAAFGRVPDNYAEPVISGDIRRRSGTAEQPEPLQAKGK